MHDIQDLVRGFYEHGDELSGLTKKLADLLLSFKGRFCNMDSVVFSFYKLHKQKLVIDVTSFSKFKSRG